MGRITWNDEEMRRVAEHVVVNKHTDTLLYKALTESAAKTLPPDRRRVFKKKQDCEAPALVLSLELAAKKFKRPINEVLEGKPLGPPPPNKKHPPAPPPAATPAPEVNKSGTLVGKRFQRTENGTKLQWSKAETNDVAKAAVMTRLPGESMVDAVQRAQHDVLPPGRCRAVIKPAQLRFAWMAADIVKWQAVKAKQDAKAQAAANAAPASPLTTKLLENTSMVPPAVATALSDRVFQTDTLLDMLANGLSELLAQTIRRALNSDVVRNAVAESVGIKRPVQPIPKVLVGGLLPGQINMMKTEFGSKIDLRFWRSDEDTDRLRANVNHVDHVFMMLDFISHSAENIVKEHPGYERVTGGMSSLRNKLAGLQPH